MNIKQYEEKFLDELLSNYPGVNWDEYVRKCHQEYMDSVAEQELDMELNKL